MGSPSSQTARGETLERPLCNFPLKKQLMKLCEETERSSETGRMLHMLAGLDQLNNPVSQVTDLFLDSLLDYLSYLLLTVFADTSRCFPADLTRSSLVGGGGGRVQLLLRPTLSQGTEGLSHRPTPELVRGL